MIATLSLGMSAIGFRVKGQIDDAMVIIAALSGC
jgi:hypothetical protein